MNVNFFEWLRDGVRQSVLLGVSDAIEQIGTPSDDSLNPNVAEMLKLSETAPKKRSNRGQQRRRLGKSLKDIEATPAEPS